MFLHSRTPHLKDVAWFPFVVVIFSDIDGVACHRNLPCTDSQNSIMFTRSANLCKKSRRPIPSTLFPGPGHQTKNYLRGRKITIDVTPVTKESKGGVRVDLSVASPLCDKISQLWIYGRGEGGYYGLNTMSPRAWWPLLSGKTPYLPKRGSGVRSVRRMVHLSHSIQIIRPRRDRRCFLVCSGNSYFCATAHENWWVNFRSPFQYSIVTQRGLGDLKSFSDE